MNRWTAHQVQEWAIKIGISDKIKQILQCKNIDGAKLISLNTKDLKTFGLKLGPSIQFLNDIKEYQRGVHIYQLENDIKHNYYIPKIQNSENKLAKTRTKSKGESVLFTLTESLVKGGLEKNNGVCKVVTPVNKSRLREIAKEFVALHSNLLCLHGPCSSKILPSMMLSYALQQEYPVKIYDPKNLSEVESAMRSHNVYGVLLLDEVEKLYDEAEKLYDEAEKLYDEAEKLYDEAEKLYDYDEVKKLHDYDEVKKLHNEASSRWFDQFIRIVNQLPRQTLCHVTSSSDYGISLLRGEIISRHLRTPLFNGSKLQHLQI